MAAWRSRRNLMKAMAEWLLMLANLNQYSILQLVSLFVMRSNHFNTNIKQQKSTPRNHQKAEEGERFSSFETPPPSDQDNQDFSDFQTSREKSAKRIEGQHSRRRERDSVKVEELPLQPQKTTNSDNKQQMAQAGQQATSEQNPQKCNRKAGTAVLKRPESPKLKQNCGMRFNYMQKIERHLTTIQEEGREQARESAQRAPYRTAKYHSGKLSAFEYSLDCSYGQRIYYDTNIALMEQQRMEMIILEQENISLRERVMLLEKELRARDEDTIRREAELAQRISAANEECLSSARKEAKNRLLEEVSVLQAKCREMREEMKLYKQRQEDSLKKLLAEKESVRVENAKLRAGSEYQAKFVEVFLNMVEKLPIELDPAWSRKRAIAVGWKVVKHFVKKAMKLGIPPPAISHKQHL